jgi:hypothetical protein
MKPRLSAHVGGYRNVVVLRLRRPRTNRRGWVSEQGVGMKRKAAKPNLVSTEVSDGPPTVGHSNGQVFFEEARGKIVNFIRYTEQSTGLPVFEIRFTDLTFLFIEPVPSIQFSVRYLRTSRGNIQTIRDYETVPGH